MQNTTHYNLKKPDYTDFADVFDINDNMDTIDEKLAAPDGDGRDQTVSFTDADLDSGITSFPNFLTKIVSGMKMAKFLRDFKAGMGYVLHVGNLVNNATCTESGKALDARMGKTLQDQITSLNDSLTKDNPTSLTVSVNIGTVLNNTLTRVGNVVCFQFRMYDSTGTGTSLSSGTTIAKFPSGYRTRSGGRAVIGYCGSPGVTNGRIPILCFISQNGDLTLGDSRVYTEICLVGTFTI